jgi:hypothetical protein
MASVPPNTIASGGISPRGWTRELTELAVTIDLTTAATLNELNCFKPENNCGGMDLYPFRLVYLIEEKQLTKDSKTIE